LSKKNPTDSDYTQQVEESEVLLLSIYQQAQEIMTLFPYHNSSQTISQALEQPNNMFSQELFGVYAQQLQIQKNLPQAEGGSCPAIEKDSGEIANLTSGPPSNLDILNGIIKGKTPESLLKKERYDDYKCPDCGTTIKGEFIGKSETWTPKCPNPECDHLFQCAN
jgi:predicted RNA-binding Zn-ribbon protein involved in translation (DUF1610 family)